MRRRLLLTLVILAVIGAAALTNAGATQAHSHPYTIYGLGTATCGKWVADQQKHPGHDLELSWILGFVSAADYRGGSMLRKADVNDIEVFINSYCVENPQRDVSDGAEALVRELERK